MSHTMQITAFMVREWRVSLGSRFLVALPVAGFVAGLVPLLTLPDAERYVAGPLFLLQILLYGVPLSAILAGTGSCHSETDEQPLLTTLPVCRGARVVGKFLGLLSSIALALLLCVLPSALGGMGAWAAGLILAYGLGIGALFLALGMWCGLAIHDGVKAHLTALLCWLALTLGAGLPGYLTLGGLAELNPGLWAATLMLSPLDALRIGLLFSFEPVPFATDTLPQIARWWLAHPGPWFALLATVSTAAVLSLAARAGHKA